MGTKKIKANISIEASRKALHKELKKKCNGEIIEKAIPFTNDDVPKYLEFLRYLEKESRKTKIVVS